MYVKIHDSIFGSSIMEEDIEIRYIWLCMLTIADFEGFVDETIPALARRFNIDEILMQKAIKCFLEPDPSSRTADNDGRRIEPMRKSFGWQIINYEKYRNMRNAEDRKEYMRKYMRGYLPKYRQGKVKQEKDETDDKQESLSKFNDKHDKPKQKQKQKQNKEIYKRKVLLPIDYKLTQAHIDYAISKNISNIDYVFTDFCLYHKKQGNKFIDWFAAWQTWIRKKLEFDKKNYIAKAPEPNIKDQDYRAKVLKQFTSEQLIANRKKIADLSKATFNNK